MTWRESSEGRLLSSKSACHSLLIDIQSNYSFTTILIFRHYVTFINGINISTKIPCLRHFILNLNAPQEQYIGRKNKSNINHSSPTSASMQPNNQRSVPIAIGMCYDIYYSFIIIKHKTKRQACTKKSLKNFSKNHLS